MVTLKPVHYFDILSCMPVSLHVVEAYLSYLVEDKGLLNDAIDLGCCSEEMLHISGTRNILTRALLLMIISIIKLLNQR